MSPLRSGVEISHHRRPHFMVLRALPRANLINTWLQPGIGSGAKAAVFNGFAGIVLGCRRSR
jgi:hypothetical protein